MLSDLREVSEIDFFDNRVKELKEKGADLPNNLTELRKKALLRNISALTVEVRGIKDIQFRKDRQERLVRLKKELLQKYPINI